MSKMSKIKFSTFSTGTNNYPNISRVKCVSINRAGIFIYSTGFRPPKTIIKPSQFSSSESAIHQTNSIQNELEHKTSYVFLKFIDFIKFQNNFKFTSTFALKRFQTEIKTKSMFVRFLQIH